MNRALRIYEERYESYAEEQAYFITPFKTSQAFRG
jgi:hypothetical protein